MRTKFLGIISLSHGEKAGEETEWRWEEKKAQRSVSKKLTACVI